MAGRLLTIWVLLSQTLVRKVCSGIDTHFWEDYWHQDGHLMDRYPRLYALEVYKGYKVSDRWLLDNGSWVDSWV